MNFLDEDFNQTKSTEKENATNSFIPAKRSFKLQSFKKWLQLGNLFSKFAAAFKIIGPKPASNGSVRRIKFNWEIQLVVTLKL